MKNIYRFIDLFLHIEQGIETEWRGVGEEVFCWEEDRFR